MSLVETLVQNLGVSNQQAEGGAGLLLQLAKDKLGSGEFSQLNDVIPDDFDSLMGAAPSVESGAAAGGGLMGMVGAAAEALGAGDAMGKLGDLAGLVGGFEKLGLDAGMLTKFAEAILDFVKSKGGDQLVGVLQSIMK
ncbi:MAG: DUF2780 domain-containing protein [Planctomycetota bacterium]